jgi:hypothetical protein
MVRPSATLALLHMLTPYLRLYLDLLLCCWTFIPSCSTLSDVQVLHQTHYTNNAGRGSVASVDDPFRSRSMLVSLWWSGVGLLGSIG